ncbi:hypothetical protein NL676_032566 [Syzygium grande]|nr:hypothetical protein NL676_032566 [Syzygium grande]
MDAGTSQFAVSDPGGAFNFQKRGARRETSPSLPAAAASSLRRKPQSVIAPIAPDLVAVRRSSVSRLIGRRDSGGDDHFT